MKRPTLIVVTLLVLCPFVRGYAQSDSAAFAVAVAQFHRVLFPENGLYNGSEYLDYASTLKSGHPYFGPNLSQPGSVFYDGIRYDSLRLWYDLVVDGVVLSPPNMGFKMVLLSPKVQSFALGDRRFLRLTRDSTRDIRTGFYELLYEGRVRLFRRSVKHIQEYVSQQGVERFIEADSSYYLDRGGRFYAINRKSSLLDAVGDKRKDVQAFLRKNKIKLRHDKDEALIKVITYYDELLYANASR
jgi:hypothetical protein